MKKLNEDDWTMEDTKAILNGLGWLGKTLIKVTAITAVAATTGTVGLSLLARLKEADYPLE